MNRITVKRPAAALLLGAVALIGKGGIDTAHAATVAKTYKGAAEQMQQWGTIRVSIVVKQKKITDVKISSGAHTARSQIIQSNALPILRSETLSAQTANINEVSGATDMSSAYISSLQSAISAARRAGALK